MLKKITKGIYKWENAKSTPAINTKLKNPLIEGVKMVGKKAKYLMGGGQYGERMNQKNLKTPEGRKINEEIKKRGMMDVLRKGIKK